MLLSPPDVSCPHTCVSRCHCLMLCSLTRTGRNHAHDLSPEKVGGGQAVGPRRDNSVLSPLHPHHSDSFPQTQQGRVMGRAVAGEYGHWALVPVPPLTCWVISGNFLNISEPPASTS